MAARALISLAFGTVSLLAADVQAASADPFATMAPKADYQMDRGDEISLARSAAPASISDKAEILVMGEHGFETAATGSNGFVCLVERSWDKDFGDPDFWNPRIRAPNCVNEASARTVLPGILERAEWVLAGASEDEMRERSKTSAKANMSPASGAMAIMMSKRQHLTDSEPTNWCPHVMFYSPHIDNAAWGANLKGSPIIGADLGPVTYFFIPVGKWSDGTPLMALGDHEHRH